MRSEPVEALLFDLGGVVIEIDFRRCLGSWASDAGCGIDDLSGRFVLDVAYEAHEVGALDFAGYCKSLRVSLDVDLTDEQLLAGWNDIYVGEIAGMTELLAAVAQRYPTYAFTNTNPTHQAVWTTQFPALTDAFVTTFVSSEIGLRKPDRDAFDHISAQIGVPSSRILFFDDSPENVEGAHAAGLQAVQVTSIDSVRDALEQLG